MQAKGGAGRRGRPAYEPTPEARRTVKGMAAVGVPAEDIARVLDVDPKTLRKHFRRELDTGSVEANARVAQSLFQKAIGNTPQSTIAAIFWLKTRAGWVEKPAAEAPGKKELKQDEAEKATQGKFAPGRPPLKVVK